MLHTLMIFQAILSVLMIITVLLQFGKGAEAGLMGGASEAVFTGGQQGNFLTKTTAVLAILFLSNSVYLARLQGRRASESLLANEAPVARSLNNDAEAKKAKAEAEAAEKAAKETKSPPAAEAKNSTETKK